MRSDEYRMSSIQPARFRVPQQLNAFTLLGLLRDSQVNSGLAASDQAELAASIASIEQHRSSPIAFNRVLAVGLQAMATWYRASPTRFRCCPSRPSS
jgi:hypothetical protein